DTNGDVGPNHYVQTVNASFAVWDKNGTVLLTPRTINTLFAGFGGVCQTRNDGDPIVLYDSMADRWFINQFTSGAPYTQCTAISQTSDPTGAYYRYAFQTSATDFYDYQKYGVWPDGYYMTANVFEATGGFRPSMIAFDRARMLQGLSATFQEFNPGNYYGNILPADLDGANLPPAGAPNPFVTTSGNSTLMHLWQFHVDWATPANSSLTGPINLPIAPKDSNLCGGARNCLPQLGTTVRLDTIYDHPMFRLAYRNYGDHESLTTNETVDENGQDHAAIRWYEVRNPTTAPYVYQQGTFSPDAEHRWMGSAAMDRDGNLAIGYSVTSPTIYPSIRYAGRLATDPLNELSQGETTMYPGSGSQTGPAGRWGDYSDMTVDPVDDCTFWYTTEYYATTSSTGWRTRIGKFKFPSCGSITPSPTRTGTPPTATRTSTATSTPIPQPTQCANYAYTTGTGTIDPGTTRIDGTGCDDCTTLTTLPFPIQLYDQTFTSAYVSSNAVIQFVSSDSAYGNACLPVPVFAYAVTAYWDDLITTGAGRGIFTSVTGSAPNRVFNVEWRAAVLNAQNAPINVEVQFIEGSPNFNIIYGTSVGDTGTGATIGVQRDQTAFTQVACNLPGSVAPGRQYTFTLPACPLATATSTAPPATATNTAVAPSATRTVPPNATNTPGGGATATPCPVQFSDVSPTDPFYPFIRCLACRGIISGYADGTFRGGNNLTRGQASKIISNAAGFSDAVPSTQQSFQDVPPSDPFWVFIERLATRGYISGYQCGFPPAGNCVPPANRPYFLTYNNITRGQISKVVANAAGLNNAIPSTQQTFADVPYGNAFWIYIERLAALNVISGYNCGGPGEPCDGQNRPYYRWTANVTRNQAAKIVANTFFPGCQTPSNKVN
ncbi:MAG TPA: S-layer homology domain-containing protein, partial [Chloroflexia bacterium]|nr:S-layer homology domain-containing protein [Chloroflexia bacterium]